MVVNTGLTDSTSIGILKYILWLMVVHYNSHRKLGYKLGLETALLMKRFGVKA